MYILGMHMYISCANMYILGVNMYILGANSWFQGFLLSWEKKSLLLLCAMVLE